MKCDLIHIKTQRDGLGMGPMGVTSYCGWLTKNLTLVSEIEGDWRVFSSKRAFSEKIPGYKASLELWTTWGPLFKLKDTVTRGKRQEDVTLDSCGAVVAPDVPEVGYSTWGQEVVPAMFESLQSPPQVDMQAEGVELVLSVWMGSKHKNTAHIAKVWRWN